MKRKARSMLPELSDFKAPSQRLNLCMTLLYLTSTYREIEKPKEELVPKRGDFFHVKVFRKD